MSQMLTVTDAKARLSELVAAVAATQDHVDITRNGNLAVVLVRPRGGPNAAMPAIE